MTDVPTDDGFEVAYETPQGWAPHQKGDSITGKYLGREQVNAEHDQNWYAFRILGLDGTAYLVSETYQLAKAFEGIDPGVMVRITYLDTVDISNNRTMNTYRIETKR